MPQYWLCVLTPENYEIVKEKLVWGVSDRHKNKILQVKPGDLLVMYIIGEKKIKGIFEATSEPFTEKKEIFMGGIYPNRVKLEKVKESEKGIDIKKLLPKLETFKRKDSKWVGTIIGKAMIKLSKNDYKLIFDSIK